MASAECLYVAATESVQRCAVQTDSARATSWVRASSLKVVVPNVVRHPGVKFFGVPKIGAYVAVPVK
jgi:hypothetical protein